MTTPEWIFIVSVILMAICLIIREMKRRKSRGNGGPEYPFYPVNPGDPVSSCRTEDYHEGIDGGSDGGGGDGCI